MMLHDQVDPIVEMLDRLGRVTTTEELEYVLHPKDLFMGYGGREEIFATIQRRLAEIVDSKNTYLDLAAEDFNMHGLALEPFRKALLALSVREQWPQEMLHQGILANTGWLEEVNTRLRLREHDEHERTPNVPAISGMPPTARKSSLYTFITSTCLSGSQVPAKLQKGKCCTTDGTLKGHRTNIFNHRRSGISTDEIACAYKTKQSQEAQGIHFAVKQKLCTYLHCEADTAVTGPAHYASGEYSFFHLAYGQIGAAFEVLEPKEGGFTKRFHIAFANYKACSDPDQPAAESKAFILRYHDWMAEHCLGGTSADAEEEETVDHDDASAAPAAKKARPYEPQAPASPAYCDDATFKMFQTVLLAITDFQDDLSNAGKRLNKYLVQKLGYADSDLAKYANVTMRTHQYCESLTGLSRAAVSHARRQWNHFEAMYAIRMWLRQLEWHAALYRSAPTAGEDQVQLIPSANARLEEIERVVRYLLVDLRGWNTLVNFTATRNVSCLLYTS